MKRAQWALLILQLAILVCLIGGWSSTYDTVTPAGTDAPAVLDDRIREVKAAIQERENIDHYWPLTGTQVSDADAGKHKRVLFQGALASDPTLEADEGTIYPKAVGGVTEVFWKDENGNVKQLTTAGKLNIAATEAVILTGNQTVGGIKTFSSTPAFTAGFTVGQDTDVGPHSLQGTRFISDVATGTAPLSVTSTTKVSNLNVDQVDGVSLGGLYNSGWFAASAGTTYTKAHGLGASPGIMCVWYSDTSDGTGDVVLVGAAGYNGASAIVVDVDATNIIIRGQSYLAVYYDAGGTARNRTTGYLKIVAIGAF